MPSPAQPSPARPVPVRVPAEPGAPTWLGTGSAGTAGSQRARGGAAAGRWPPGGGFWGGAKPPQPSAACPAPPLPQLVGRSLR